MKQPFLNSEEIGKIVNRISTEINHSYPEKKEIVFLSMGNEPLPFCLDLMRQIESPVAFDIVYLNVLQRGNTKYPVFTKLPTIDLHDKNVILVTDHVNSGDTLTMVKMKLEELYSTKSVTFCSLFKKKYSKAYINYFGKVLPQHETHYGYGVSLNEHQCNLPEVYTLKQKKGK